MHAQRPGIGALTNHVGFWLGDPATASSDNARPRCNVDPSSFVTAPADAVDVTYSGHWRLIHINEDDSVSVP
jgi:hypothetical protein